jgi:hypothetical protein
MFVVLLSLCYPVHAFFVSTCHCVVFAILLVRRRTFVRCCCDLAFSNATGDFDLPRRGGGFALDLSFSVCLFASLGDM